MKTIDHVRTGAGANTAIREPDPVAEALEESFPASDPPAWTGVTGVGPPPPAAPASEPTSVSQQTALAQQTRGEHDALLVAMHRLEAALAAAAPGREQAWNARVLKDVRGVQEYLARHVASAEAPDGLFAEIDLTRPTLARRVDQLRREHADLRHKAGALERRVEEFWCVEWAMGAEDRPDTADIRQRAARLLGALRDHQAHEADLIFETFHTDIGAGD
jgi:hypothetical protein